MSAKTARALLVWFHVLTSVGWMTMALCMFILVNADSARAAELLDEELLRHLGGASAFSGLMLAALTPWGYFRYWWVLAKFAITLGQLYAGIFILSNNLQRAAAGEPATGVLLVGSLLMASAFGFQAWLSVAKPWKHPRWVQLPLRRLQTGPAWLFLVGIGIPIVDYLMWKAPMLSLLTALVYPLVRSRQLAAARQA